MTIHQPLPRRRDTQPTEPRLELHPPEPEVVPREEERVAIRDRGIREAREQLLERADDPCFFRRVRQARQCHGQLLFS